MGFYDDAAADLADDTAAAAATLRPGAIEVEGKPYLRDAKGVLVPLEAVKPQHLLEDEVVRKVVGYAAPLSAQIARFRQHTFDDVDGYVDMVRQEYGASLGGKKGNVTLTTFDGLMKVQVQVSDLLAFGAELQAAKTLVDECLREWSADSRPELRAIVERAFNVDQAGLVNRAELLSLLRLEIDDGRWRRAMQAIRDSMKPVGTKRYVRVYRRPNAEAPWEAVSIDAATA